MTSWQHLRRLLGVKTGGSQTKGTLGEGKDSRWRCDFYHNETLRGTLDPGHGRVSVLPTVARYHPHPTRGHCMSVRLLQNPRLRKYIGCYLRKKKFFLEDVGLSVCPNVCLFVAFLFVVRLEPTVLIGTI